MRDVYILGVGMTKFGKFPEKRAVDFGREACWDAIQDAGVDRKDIEAAYCGHVYQGSVIGQLIMRELGLTGIPVVNVENACSSGSTAFREAYIAVAAGLYDLALVVGVEQLSTRVSGVLPPKDTDYEGTMGLIMPSVFALRGRLHMEKYGTTIEQFAKIRVKNSIHAAQNPRAQFRKVVTVEEVNGAKMVCEPLTMLHCCPNADGGAAAVICSEKVVRNYTARKLRVAASVLLSGTMEQAGDDMTVSSLTSRAAQQAYEKAGLGPEDLSLVELHDCFTTAELMHYENLGLCPRGEGGRMIDEGKTMLGGKIPVNVSGGLLCKGHPLGATGVGQIAEVVWHLRGEAGSRQVEGAKAGLTHCMGGAIGGVDGASCTVNIIVRD